MYGFVFIRSEANLSRPDSRRRKLGDRRWFQEEESAEGNRRPAAGVAERTEGRSSQRLEKYHSSSGSVDYRSNLCSSLHRSSYIYLFFNFMILFEYAIGIPVLPPLDNKVQRRRERKANDPLVVSGYLLFSGYVNVIDDDRIMELEIFDPITRLDPLSGYL